MCTLEADGRWGGEIPFDPCAPVVSTVVSLALWVTMVVVVVEADGRGGRREKNVNRQVGAGAAAGIGARICKDDAEASPSSAIKDPLESSKGGAIRDGMGAKRDRSKVVVARLARLDIECVSLPKRPVLRFARTLGAGASAAIKELCDVRASVAGMANTLSSRARDTESVGMSSALASSSPRARLTRL